MYLTFCNIFCEVYEYKISKIYDDMMVRLWDIMKKYCYAQATRFLESSASHCIVELCEVDSWCPFKLHFQRRFKGSAHFERHKLTCTTCGVAFAGYSAIKVADNLWRQNDYNKAINVIVMDLCWISMARYFIGLYHLIFLCICTHEIWVSMSKVHGKSHSRWRRLYIQQKRSAYCNQS